MSVGRLEELWDRYQNGADGDAVVSELNALLQVDPDARRRLVEICLFEVHLYEACAVANSERRPTLQRWRRVAGWLAAASVVLVVGATSVWFLRPASTAGPTIVSGQARISGEVVQGIPLDQPFEAAGEAPLVIRLADGAHAEFRPGSQAMLQRTGARPLVGLIRGAGGFTVPPGKGQFRVETPLGSVMALGTEFTVDLRNRPARRAVMLVAVKEGRVEVDAKGGAKKVLAAGQRLAVGDDGQMNDTDDGDQNNQDGDNQNK